MTFIIKRDRNSNRDHDNSNQSKPTYNRIKQVDPALANCVAIGRNIQLLYIL